jgi:hypothetical protein
MLAMLMFGMKGNSFHHYHELQYQDSSKNKKMQFSDHFANVLFVLQLLIWIVTSCLMVMLLPSSLLNNL